MPVAVQQRMLARVRDQDESLGILIGVFAINTVLRRSCHGEAYYYGVSFLAEVGYWNTERGFGMTIPPATLVRKTYVERSEVS